MSTIRPCRLLVQVKEKEAVIPLLASTAHYLLQMFNGILWIDPESSIVNAYAVCRHGLHTGLLMDSLGRTEAFKLVYELPNNWTKILGKHTMKFGGDYRYAMNIRNASDNNRTGVLNFNRSKWLRFGSRFALVRAG